MEDAQNKSWHIGGFAIPSTQGMHEGQEPVPGLYPRIPVMEQVLLREIDVHGGRRTLLGQDALQQLPQHALHDGGCLVGSQIFLGKKRWHKTGSGFQNPCGIPEGSQIPGNFVPSCIICLSLLFSLSHTHI